MLFEVAYGSYRADWGGRAKTDPYTGDLIRMTEQCTAGCPNNGNIAGLIYRSQSVDLFISGRNKNRIYNWRANVARVSCASRPSLISASIGPAVLISTSNCSPALIR